MCSLKNQSTSASSIKQAISTASSLLDLYFRYHSRKRVCEIVSKAHGNHPGPPGF